MNHLNVNPDQNSLYGLACTLPLINSTEAVSHSALTANYYNFAIPILFVLAIAVFLLTSFLKQKK